MIRKLNPDRPVQWGNEEEEDIVLWRDEYNVPHPNMPQHPDSPRRNRFADPVENRDIDEPTNEHVPQQQPAAEVQLPPQQQAAAEVHQMPQQEHERHSQEPRADVEMPAEAEEILEQDGVEAPHILGAEQPRPTFPEFVRCLTEEEKRELLALLIADQPQQERRPEVSVNVVVNYLN